MSPWETGLTVKKKEKKKKQRWLIINILATHNTLQALEEPACDGNCHSGVEKMFSIVAHYSKGFLRLIFQQVSSVYSIYAACSDLMAISSKQKEEQAGDI